LMVDYWILNLREQVREISTMCFYGSSSDKQ